MAIPIETGVQEFTKGPYTISTDKGKLDVETVHRFLSSTYWAKGIPMDVVRKLIQHSLCYGVYYGGEQVGFGRVITDYSTFAYISDVYVVEEHRGKGLAKWMLESMLQHPGLQGLRRWMLVTRDAQALYRQVGFKEAEPGRVMEIKNPDAYKR